MILPDLTGWADDFHSGCVFHAARQRGIPVKRIMAPREHGGVPEPWLSFAVGGRGYFYSQAILISNPDPADSSQAHHVNRQLAHVTVDKYATKRLLVELGVPVPSGERFAAGDVEKAEAMFMAMGRPVCVKPSRAEQGRSVYPWLCDRTDLPRGLPRRRPCLSRARGRGACGGRAGAPLLRPSLGHRPPPRPAGQCGGRRQAQHRRARRGQERGAPAPGVAGCLPCPAGSGGPSLSLPAGSCPRQPAGGGQARLPARHLEPRHRRRIRSIAARSCIPLTSGSSRISAGACRICTSSPWT